MELKPNTPFFNFYSDVRDIAETKYKANIKNDSREWLERLFGEFQQSGVAPKQQRKWLLDRLKGEFKSMDKPPAWLNMENSRWPFHKGKPMVFLGQISLKSSPETKDLLPSHSVAYIFGLTDEDKYGDEIMVYQEVTQDLNKEVDGVAGLVALRPAPVAFFDDESGIGGQNKIARLLWDQLDPAFLEQWSQWSDARGADLLARPARCGLRCVKRVVGHSLFSSGVE